MKRSEMKSGGLPEQWYGIICALVVAASIVATWPVADMGFQDDWSYIRTALEFARTGHFVYNGWSTAMLGWMVPWGALFIKIFRSSFTAARFSILPIAAMTTYLFHACLVRCGVRGRDAILGALTLGLSPVFTPMAASFMTDVPGLFVIVLCLYLCLRALRARLAIFWLVSATFVGILGGTVRQISWLAALVMVPSTAWLLRRHRGMRVAGTLLWVGSIISVVMLLHWWNAQPYSVPEKIDRGDVDAAMVHHFGGKLAKGLLCLLLLVYPVLAAWLTEIGKLPKRALVRVAVALVIVNSLLMMMNGGMRELWVMPWIGHLLYSVIYGRGEFPGAGPITMSLNTRMIVSLFVFVTALILIESVLARKDHPPNEPPVGLALTWREMAWVFAPFWAAYCALLLPRTLYEFLYDRYFLGLMPFAIIALLRLHRRWFGEHVDWIAYVVLILFSIVSVAGTHDWFAVNRARVRAVNVLRAAGVPKNLIQGGFEYDGWTQIDVVGHVNEKRIRVPRATYIYVRRPKLPPNCQHFFSFFSSGVDPEYVIVSSPMHCFADTTFSAIDYRAWLPPFERKIYVQKVRDTPEERGEN